MAAIRYEQLATKQPASDKEFIKPHNKVWKSFTQRIILSLSLILVYFSLSISLTFYQRWLLKDFHFPLTVVMYHLIVKWILSVVIRTLLHIYTGIPQLVLPFMTCLRSVCPTGLASGIDVGFSNWGLALVTVSLYTMTKSTTIIFILGFAIILGLEKKSWSLVMIVVMISAGLIMFTYKATQFDTLGFMFLLLASFSAGLRWTFAQKLMQKSKLGLHNPIDMVFHVQPWMFLSLLPFTLGFEGLECIRTLMALPDVELVPSILKISVGATLAFAMEISEFLVVTYTSSLTLSVAGIFKEMCILVLAVEVGGDQISLINVLGLVICLLGLTGHTMHKLYIINKNSHTNISWTSDNLANIEQNEKLNQIDHVDQVIRRNPNNISKQDFSKPLLDYLDGKDSWSNEGSESDSEDDSNRVIFDVVQRRDNIR